MAHTGDKICYGVETFVVFNGKVLLRMHDKYNFWCSIGGHINPGEDPVEAAIREVKEETGLTVRLLNRPSFIFKDGTVDLPLPNFINRHKLPDGHEHVVLVYSAIADSAEILPAPEEKQTGFKWLSFSELL